MWAIVKNDTRLVPGILTGALGFWLCWLGNEMPRPTGWSSAPGLFPVIIGAGLVLMAIALLIERQRILRLEAQKRLEPKHETLLEAKMEEILAEPPMTRTAILRVIAITAVIGLYILALKFLQFEVATFAFLAMCMFAFGERSIIKILVISVLVTIGISMAFVYFLETLLPGNGSIVDSILYG
ncbi:tripartite tricarboxylate transporter TctB family protein [Microvirga aerophila]|uniref:DUF1468 domain-containing protein n=1 Tax=Microvirga aerophila TaxID=670291 RepID=A0A512BXN0_9HYPH|nr:tripartite tricarboxylate transporter TctB family protein [Microvirga aerophila]GEO16710.1 hypothetical protein MAE02_44060 [Microvirga aerophila]